MQVRIFHHSNETRDEDGRDSVSIHSYPGTQEEESIIIRPIS